MLLSLDMTAFIWLALIAGYAYSTWVLAKPFRHRPKTRRVEGTSGVRIDVRTPSPVAQDSQRKAVGA